MKWRLAILAALVATSAYAQSWGGSNPCFWSGGWAECQPTSGIKLKEGRLLQLQEYGGGTDIVNISPPPDITANWTLFLPPDNGDANEFMQTDANGVTTWEPVDAGTDITTGTLPLARGGTAKSMTASAGAMCYSDSDSLEFNTPGTASDWALSGGTGTPTFSSTTTIKKRFAGGYTSEEYYGTLPEVGGSTPFQMVVGNKNISAMSSGSANTTRLPTTSVKKGEIYEIHNTTTTGTNAITSSDGDAIITLYQGFARFMALQDTPTDTTHWYLMNIEDNNFFTGTSTATNWTSGSLTYHWARTGSSTRKIITLTIPDHQRNATGNMSTAITLGLGSMPVGIRPVQNNFFPVAGYVTNVASGSPLIIYLQTDGTGTLYSAYNGSGNFACTNGQTCGCAVSTLTWVN